MGCYSDPGKRFRFHSIDFARFFLTCLACALCLTNVSFSSAQELPHAIPPEVFWAQVDSTLAWFETHSEPTSAEWQAEARRWEKINLVSFPGQPAGQVDTSYLVAQMQEKNPDQVKIKDYLSALKRSRALTNTAGGEKELAALNKVLARPEFQYRDGEQNLIQKILQWLLDRLARVLEFLFGDVGGGMAIPPQVSIPVTFLIILAILGFVFRDTLRNLFREVDLVDETQAEHEILSARLAGQKADELSRAGDYRHALRYLYLSALLLLDERGLLRYNRTQTNREYLRQVRSRPDLSEHLKFVVDTFDRVWYGFQPINESSYSQYAQHVSALEAIKE